MKYKDIADSIVEMKNADLRLRQHLIARGTLSDGYDTEMELLHNENAAQLDLIIDQIGYPTIGKVGSQASEAAWLIIQHAISKPAFMRKCLALLKEEVRQGEAYPINVAYLTDRVAVFEGRAQLYGTQFDWDDYGVLSPSKYDDLAKVDARRAAVGLRPLAEQIQVMRRRAQAENQVPPTDKTKRDEGREQWRKSVGWIV